MVSLAVEGREDPALVDAIIRAAFHRDMAYILPEPVKRPTLVVTGEFDATCTPEGGRPSPKQRVVPGV